MITISCWIMLLVVDQPAVFLYGVCRPITILTVAVIIIAIIKKFIHYLQNRNPD